MNTRLEIIALAVAGVAGVIIGAVGGIVLWVLGATDDAHDVFGDDPA